MSQPNNNHKYTKIFVGGLAWKTTTQDLKRFFQQFGEVLDANVVSENFPGGILKSKGYGFVTFRDAESASRVCEPPYPVIDGRQTNINLAHIGAKNNTNQNGLQQQAQPWHQYPNGSFNQVASHQYQLISTNPHLPQVLCWDPNYGYYYLPNYRYSTTMSCHHVSTYACGMQQNWHQMRSTRPPIRISRPPRGPRIQDISDTDQEGVSTGDVVRKDNNEEVDGGVDEQQGKDLEENGEDTSQDQ